MCLVGDINLREKEKKRERNISIAIGKKKVIERLAINRR